MVLLLVLLLALALIVLFISYRGLFNSCIGADKKHWKRALKELDDTSSLEFKFGTYDKRLVPCSVRTPSYHLTRFHFQDPDKIIVFYRKKIPEISDDCSILQQEGEERMIVCKDVSPYSKWMKKRLLKKVNKIGIPIGMMKEL